MNVIDRLPELFDVLECTGLLPGDCRVHTDPAVQEVYQSSLLGTLAFQTN